MLEPGVAFRPKECGSFSLSCLSRENVCHSEFPFVPQKECSGEVDHGVLETLLLRDEFGPREVELFDRWQRLDRALEVVLGLRSVPAPCERHCLVRECVAARWLEH